MTNMPTQSLSGLWMFDGQSEQLDNGLALSKGITPSGQGNVLHGTFTRPCYYRIVMDEGSIAGVPNKAKNVVLNIFDENGYFGHFVWNGSDAWESRNEPVVFTAGDSPLGNQIPAVTLYPTLSLAPFREQNFPRNGAPRTVPCPLPPDGSARNGANAVLDAAEQLPELPRQHIKATGKTFEWAQPAQGGIPHLRLSFTNKDETRPGKIRQWEGQKEWGETFTGQTLGQVDFPLLGYDPRRLDLYGQAGVSTSGTTPKIEGQTLSGTPVFQYPAQASYDYVKSNLPHSPNLPWGTRPENYQTIVKSTHTEMLSSVADRARSWSLTLGMSGGLEDMLSVSQEGTYKNRIEEQTKTESRYSVSRETGTTYRLFTDVPRLDLHEDYKTAVLEKLDELLNGKQPKWELFVNKFGTHYAHAITFGQLNLLETRYSLQAELKSRTDSISFTRSAEVTLEKLVKVGGKVGADFEWADKLGKEVSAEDTKYTSVGSDNNPMAILFDLRPASELMSPIFFPLPLGPKDKNYDRGPNALFDEVRAPFIWFKLRSSFEEYLTGLGLNRPLDSSFMEDYTPRIATVSVSGLTIITPDGDWPYMYGGVSFTALKGAVLLGKQDLNIDYNNAKQMNLKDNLPGFDTVHCVIAATAKQIKAGAGCQLHSSLKNYRYVGNDNDLSFTADFAWYFFATWGPNHIHFAPGPGPKGGADIQLQIKEWVPIR